MGWYDTAQICLNGHVVNSATRQSPQFNQKFCDECGAATITKCSKCNNDIRGRYHVENVIGLSHYKSPAFCFNCGEPFPWTEERIKAAKELTGEMENISLKEKKLLEKSIDDIVRETPRTSLASNRFKRILAKTSGGTAEFFRDILIDIASETAKKMLWPDS